MAVTPNFEASTRGDSNTTNEDQFANNSGKCDRLYEFEELKIQQLEAKHWYCRTAYNKVSILPGVRLMWHITTVTHRRRSYLKVEALVINRTTASTKTMLVMKMNYRAAHRKTNIRGRSFLPSLRNRSLRLERPS